MADTFLYFAYGSNMLTRRLRERVSSAHPVATTSLSGYRLDFHKPSVDGSGKCSIEPSKNSDDIVWGVLFEIDKDEEKILDACEGKGYSERFIDVAGFTDVKTYVAKTTDAALVPYHWYKDIVMAGAIEHKLPDDYQAQICAVVSKDDPDAKRDLEARRILNWAWNLPSNAASSKTAKM